MAGAGELGTASCQRARVRASGRRMERALRRNVVAMGRTLGIEDVLSRAAGSDRPLCGRGKALLEAYSVAPNNYLILAWRS